MASDNAEHGSAHFLKDPRWTRVFLPTLQHALFVSREPFKHFTLEAPEFLSTIQDIFNRTFTNVDYELSLNDEVTKVVCQINCYHFSLRS